MGRELVWHKSVADDCVVVGQRTSRIDHGFAGRRAEEFVYRFWLENELYSALHGGRMPEGGEEYLAFYRPGGQGAEPSAAADRGGM